MVDIEKIFETVAEQMTAGDCRGCSAIIKKLAQDADLYVADSDDELVKLALEQTHLVEPE